MKHKKIYKKWNETETKKLKEYCMINKSILINVEQKNRFSGKKVFKPTNFFIRMSQFIGTKSPKQCKSKLQKLRNVIYKEIGICQSFKDQTKKNLKEFQNFEDEKIFKNSNQTTTTNTFSNLSPLPREGSLLSWDMQRNISPLVTQEYNGDLVKQDNQISKSTQDRNCFINNVSIISDKEYDDLNNNSIVFLQSDKEQIIFIN